MSRERTSNSRTPSAFPPSPVIRQALRPRLPDRLRSILACFLIALPVFVFAQTDRGHVDPPTGLVAVIQNDPTAP